MAFKTIFTDEMIEQYTKLGYWGRGTFLDHFERSVERFPDKEYVVDARGGDDFSQTHFGRGYSGCFQAHEGY